MDKAILYGALVILAILAAAGAGLLLVAGTGQPGDTATSNDTSTTPPSPGLPACYEKAVTGSLKAEMNGTVRIYYLVREDRVELWFEPYDSGGGDGGAIPSPPPNPGLPPIYPTSAITVVDIAIMVDTEIAYRSTAQEGSFVYGPLDPGVHTIIAYAKICVPIAP